MHVVRIPFCHPSCAFFSFIMHFFVVHIGFAGTPSPRIILHSAPVETKKFHSSFSENGPSAIQGEGVTSPFSILREWEERGVTTPSEKYTRGSEKILREYGWTLRKFESKQRGKGRDDELRHPRSLHHERKDLNNVCVLTSMPRSQKHWNLQKEYSVGVGPSPVGDTKKDN